MTKKIIITALLGAVLIIGIIGWFIPIGIKAEYTGNKIYQSETVNKKDINVEEFSLFGRKNKVSDFVMESTTLKGIDLEFDISANNMSTQLDIDVISVKKCSWKYSGTIYEGDDFDRDKLSGYAVYEDGTKRELKDFTLKYAPAVFRGGSNEISVQSEFGSDTISLDAIYVTGINVKGKKQIYEGKHTKKDFSFTLCYSDDTTRSVSASDIYMSEVELVSGKNHVIVTYNDKPYTVIIEAKSKHLKR